MTQDSRPQGSDPVGDFQRWLMRSGARGFGREMRGNIRKTFGSGQASREDVWESATNEPEGGGEPPECEWCPLCRAARKMRDSGPGLGSHLSSAGGLFASVLQDAVSAFEAVVATGPGAGPSPAGTASSSPPGSPGAPGEPPATTGEPPATTGEPPATTGEPPATTGEPPATTGEPPATTGEPPATTGEPPATTGEPPATTGATWEAPATTAEPPATTAEPPATTGTTWEAPGTTGEPPGTTGEPPEGPAGGPVDRG